MKYYDAHEGQYQKRLGAGQVAWDEGAYDDFDMLPLVARLLGEAGFLSGPKTALDLGCGTGALACYLAGRGFGVCAVDVSSSAIALAKEQALARGLDIDFRVGDVCGMALPEATYDLVTDSHFLHCIVFEEERRRVLQTIFTSLKSGGEFWLETMVNHPEMKPREEWNLGSGEIIWCEIAEDNDFGECVQRDGKTWLPIRRIQASAKVLCDEIQSAGFEVLWQETVAPMDENDTGTFRARCRRGGKKIAADLRGTRG